MSKEMPDELAGAERDWRRLLREPDALPGQGLFDKDAAWDRLFERLTVRPRRRFSGYRIAAVCILVLLIPAARLFQGRPTPPVKMPVAERARPVARPSVASAVGRTVPGSAVARPGSEVSTVIGKNNTGDRVRGHWTQAKQDAARRNEALGPTHDPAAALTAPGAIPAPPPVASLSEVPPETPGPAPAHLPTPAPKKQWKVVDINELEPGHDRPQGMVAGRQYRPLRLGFDIGKSNLTTQNH